MNSTIAKVIRYIGRRLIHKDTLYGTGLTWSQGEEHPVPVDVALRMLRHVDVYALGQEISEGAAKVIAGTPKKTQQQDEDEDRDQDMRDSIAQMPKDALKQFAKTHFNVDLDGRAKIESQRAQVINLFDQFGLGGGA